ncbi:MAG: aminotransferase class V-fold PLP-dependent enzyme, partial [Planctomycetota bacterium]
MPDAEWQSFRGLMQVTDRYAYFNHASVSPLPRPTRDAVVAWADDFHLHGTTNWLRWREEIEEVRRLGAKLFDADTDEIAFIRNTTEGIALVAEGLDWRAGDNVVVARSEFPSNLHPWRHLKSRGVEVREIGNDADEALDPAEYDKACDARTRLISSSWVGYLTGHRRDPAALCEIAHRYGALFFLDAIQGLGVLPLDVSAVPIDFLAADGHKWMLGPEGAGLFYVRRDNLERLRPVLVGWNSVVGAEQFSHDERDLKPRAERFEGGTYNMAGAAGLAASLRLLTEPGTEAIAARLREVTATLVDRIVAAGCHVAADRSDAHWSGIVSFAPPDESPLSFVKRAAEAGVGVMARGGRVRAAPHVYNDRSDIDRLIALLTQN